MYTPIRWSALWMVSLAVILAGCAASGNNSAGSAPPRYSVDPFWPKPLPNQWALGQVAGLHVDQRNHLWIIFEYCAGGDLF